MHKKMIMMVGIPKVWRILCPRRPTHMYLEMNSLDSILEEFSNGMLKSGKGILD